MKSGKKPSSRPSTYVAQKASAVVKTRPHLGSGPGIPRKMMRNRMPYANSSSLPTQMNYLASVRQPNEALIAWARQREGGVRAWEIERNFWGFTARDLHEEGEAARCGKRSRGTDLIAFGPWKLWVLERTEMSLDAHGAYDQSCFSIPDQERRYWMIDVGGGASVTA